MVLGHGKVLLATLYHWEDYLMYIQHKCGWLVCLKAALDIYNGGIKGYYGVPYIAQNREQMLIDKLKDLACEGIRTMIRSFHGHKLKTGAITDVQRDNYAVMVAIEFCHEIHSFKFLFNTIFDEFKREGFEDRFVKNLEPFILSGYFREEILPTHLLKKI